MADAEQINAALGTMLADQIEEQKAIEADFRARQKAMSEKAGSIYDEMLGRMSMRKPNPANEYPKEIIEIAQALRAQPRLIPPVQKFLQKLVASINAAVDAQVAAALGEVTKP